MERVGGGEEKMVSLLRSRDPKRLSSCVSEATWALVNTFTTKQFGWEAKRRSVQEIVRWVLKFQGIRCDKLLENAAVEESQSELVTWCCERS